METKIAKLRASIEAVNEQIRHFGPSYEAVLLAEPSSSEAALTAERKLLYLQLKLLQVQIEEVECSYEAASTGEEKEYLQAKLLHLRAKELSELKAKELLELKAKELLELKSKEPVSEDLWHKLDRIEKGMYATLWLNFWGELSSSASSETTEQFRTELVAFYGDAADKLNVEVPEKPLRCMVTDLRLPGKWITAGHLLARKDKAKAHVFGIRNINNPQNGLLWFRAFEEAFSVFQIVFSWDAEANTFLIHILDASLCDQKISEMELRKKVNRSLNHFMDAETKRQFESLKFGDLEGKPIIFNNLNRPYKRVLSLHAKLGIYQAKLGGILPPHLDLNKYNFDYWSEVADAQVLSTFLRDSQLWIDGKGLQEDKEEAQTDSLSVASVSRRS